MTGSRRSRSASERILIIRIAGIGDVAVASTVLERLRVDQPDAEITWLCGSSAASLVKLYDTVCDVIVVDERALFRGNPLMRARTIVALWAKLIPRRFDRVLLLHVDKRYRLLVAPLVGASICALSRAEHGAMIPVPARWLGDEYARLVGGTAHVGPIERRFGMSDLRAQFTATRPTDNRTRVVLVPGGARNVLRDDALRRWPVANYVELAGLLIDRGVDVVLVGSPDDAWVTPAFDDMAVDNRIGTLDLTGSLHAMRNCDLVVSHDTGPMHLARLVRTPLVALFGPTIPAQVLWMDETVTALWGGAHLACRPCFDGREFATCTDNICISSVSPERVLAAALERLSNGSSPTRAQRPDETPSESALP
jgi:heptosyltransferase-2